MFKGEWSINVSYQRADMISIYDSFNNKFSYYICAISHVSDGLVNPRNPEEIYWIEVKSIYMLDMPKPPALYKRKQRVESEEQSELVIDDNPK